MRKSILKGAIGKALDLTVAERLKKVDYKQLTEPFALRNEKDGAWRCEFWGKIVRSAISCVYFRNDIDLRKMVDDTVADIMTCQTPDGCISSYPYELQLSGWDLWGRKYVILALIRYFELLNPRPEILSCCCKMMDHIMSQIGEENGKKDILQCGCHDGLAASSILGAVVSLYRLTGIERFKNFAEYIIRRGCSSTGNIFECVDFEILPSSLGNGKAYEMTSCFQGLTEMALLEMNPGRAKTAQKYYNALLAREIMITGTGGAKDCSGEYWYDTAIRQVRNDCGGLGETCVTVTWMRYCVRMLQLTGKAEIADEIERSLYNALLGALSPDGTHWVHVNPTPLTGNGYKKCAVDQIGFIFGTPFGGNDCCRAQGPEGLAIAAEIAVTETENSVTVNLFEPLESGTLQINGNYPYDPQAVITFDDPEDKILRIRTPEFLCQVRFNGKIVPFDKGKYLELPHKRSANDEIILDFDFSLKEIPSPGGTGFTAIKRGPLILAEDSRQNGNNGAKISEVWHGRKLCEYAAAGNLMNENNTLTVWFKQ